MRRLSRRSILRGLGLGAASLPFLPMLESSAFGAPLPLRFVTVFHPHGQASPLYGMRSGETETQFDLRSNGCVLAPFDSPEIYGRSFKDKVLILEGLDLATAIEAGKSGHGGPPSLLTGSGVPTGPSLDQYLAVTRGLGAATRITSLVLSVGHEGPDESCISFGAGGVPIAKTIDPRKVFDSVFRDLVVSDDPAARAAAERERMRGKSLLDFVRGDLQRLNQRLGPTEQRKLDQHLTALRDIEKRLEVLQPSQACSVPPVPTSFPKLAGYDGGEPYFDDITNLQIDLLAQAMACDLTRFGTLWLNDLSRGATAGTGLTMPNDVHADLAHRYVGPTDRPGDPATWAALGKQNLYSYGKCARLLQRFSEFGVLDDVLVLITSEMGDPSTHSSRNVPMVLAGGAGGRFRMGRRLKVAEDCPSSEFYCNPPALVPHNKLLVSIAQAFGLSDVESFGTAKNTALTRGALSGLT